LTPWQRVNQNKLDHIDGVVRREAKKTAKAEKAEKQLERDQAKREREHAQRELEERQREHAAAKVVFKSHEYMSFANDLYKRRPGITNDELNRLRKMDPDEIFEESEEFYMDHLEVGGGVLKV
jgi:hypothetical protein